MVGSLFHFNILFTLICILIVSVTFWQVDVVSRPEQNKSKNSRTQISLLLKLTVHKFRVWRKTRNSSICRTEEDLGCEELSPSSSFCEDPPEPLLPSTRQPNIEDVSPLEEIRS